MSSARINVTCAGEKHGSKQQFPPRPTQGVNSSAVRRLCPSLPVDTVRVLAEAAAIHAEYARNHCMYRKGFHTDNSRTLEWRKAYNKWHRSHGAPNPNSTVEDGADFRQLGTYFLAILHLWGLVDRIDSFRESGRIPLAARDVTKFHREYWTSFQRICGEPFGELAETFGKLTETQQITAFKRFLFRKFSTDPHGRTMVPPEGTTPKKLSWAGFWLTEVEVERISVAVVTAYHQRHERERNRWQ